jgi:hypothetical protein
MEAEYLFAVAGILRLPARRQSLAEFRPRPAFEQDETPGRELAVVGNLTAMVRICRNSREGLLMAFTLEERRLLRKVSIEESLQWRRRMWRRPTGSAIPLEPAR